MLQVDPRKKSAKSKAAASFTEYPQIVWRETETYQPTLLELAEFLFDIQLDVPSGLAFPTKRPLFVFMERGCSEAMNTHARRDIWKEQAGILCGRAYIDATGQHYINVTSAFPVDTLNDAIHFRFHQESWEAVWHGMDEGSNIVGWFHTHPGMGVFLSPTDLRTQRLYFSSPWQVAVVLDPTSRQVACFAGAAGVQVLREEWFLYTMAGSIV
jgi:26S proteasome regulatory subunit N11